MGFPSTRVKPGMYFFCGYNVFTTVLCTIWYQYGGTSHGTQTHTVVVVSRCTTIMSKLSKDIFIIETRTSLLHTRINGDEWSHDDAENTTNCYTIMAGMCILPWDVYFQSSISQVPLMSTSQELQFGGVSFRKFASLRLPAANQLWLCRWSGLIFVPQRVELHTCPDRFLNLPVVPALHNHFRGTIERNVCGVEVDTHEINLFFQGKYTYTSLVTSFSPLQSSHFFVGHTK